MRGQPNRHTTAFRASHLRVGEQFFGYLEGWIKSPKVAPLNNFQAGQFILTNQRLCLFHKGRMRDQLSELEFSEITSIDAAELSGFRYIQARSNTKMLVFRTLEAREIFELVLARLEAVRADPSWKPTEPTGEAHEFVERKAPAALASPPELSEHTKFEDGKPKAMSRLKIALIVVGACAWGAIVTTAIISNNRTGAWDKALSSKTELPTTAATQEVATKEAPVKAPPEEPSTSRRIDFQVASKMKLEAQLRDPDSATYDDVRAHLISKPGEDANYAFCGYVNAKNGFGGYSGKQRFVANPLIVVLEQGTRDFEKIWTMACVNSKDEGDVWF
jgi:hypothetical protein